VEDVLAGSFLDQLPTRLIGDKAYDSDPLDEKLATEYGIEQIAPNRRGRKHRTRAEMILICRCPAGAFLAANLHARTAAGGCSSCSVKLILSKIQAAQSVCFLRAVFFLGEAFLRGRPSGFGTNASISERWTSFRPATSRL